MKLTPTAVRSSCAAALLALATACGGAVSDGAPAPVAGCTADTDCPTNFTCSSGACVYNPPYVASCTVNTDCPNGEVCSSGSCVAGSGGGSGGGSAGGSGGGSGGGSTCTDTWTNYAQAAFNNECVGCHSEFSTYSGVIAEQSQILSRITSGSMPQGGWQDPSDQNRIVAWLNCGAPQ